MDGDGIGQHKAGHQLSVCVGEKAVVVEAHQQSFIRTLPSIGMDKRKKGVRETDKESVHVRVCEREKRKKGGRRGQRERVRSE